MKQKLKRRRRADRFIRFRVYCGPKQGSGLFVYARVFRTRKEMLRKLRAEARATGTEPVTDDTGAVMETYSTIKYSASGRGRMLACIGCISFSQDRLGTETVAHEFGHAMFAWAERKMIKHPGTRIASDEMLIEEEFCYTLGRMCRRFVARAVKLGLYKE